MATQFNKFNQFVEDLAKKVHSLKVGGDQLKLALCASVNPPVSTNAILADLTQISYTNLSSRNLTVSGASQTLGIFKLLLTDLVLSASGGNVAAFRYIVLYNDTPTSPADPLIGWWDRGSDVVIEDTQNFTIDFDNVAGVLQIFSPS